MLSPKILITTLATGLSLSISAAAPGQNAAESAESIARSNAITDRYLTAVQAEVIGRVDSKIAKAGQEVDVRTTRAATLANGTELPRGTKLVAHVTQAVPVAEGQTYGMLTLTFDHAEVQGKNVPVRGVIRGVGPAGGAGPAQPGFGDPGTPMGLPSAGSMGPGSGGIGGNGRNSTRNNIPLGGSGGVGGVGGGDIGGMPGSGSPGDPSGGGLPSISDPTAPTTGRGPIQTHTVTGTAAPIPNQKVTEAGETLHPVPKATGLPGVMLTTSSSSTASGTLMAAGRNIELNSGTLITLGVITK
jgi:hypothetical protein